MKQLTLILSIFIVVIISSTKLTAQTITIGANQYAFQYSVDPDFGMFFNTTDAQYELRDGSARPIFAIDANTGAHKRDIFFNNTSDLIIGGNRYAFRFANNKNYGLFFNQALTQYEFRTGDASSIFSIGADDGNLLTHGRIHVGVVSGVLAKFTVNAEAGSDVVRFRTDGTTRFIINSLGNTGIGTSVPSNRLSVNGSANITASLGIGTSTPQTALHVDGGQALIGASGGTLAKLTVNAALNEEILRLRSAGTTRLLVNSSGNVGILTGSPTTALDVHGEVSFASTLGDKISLFDDRIGQTDMYGIGVESNTLYFKSNGQYAWLTQENVAGGTPKMLLTTTGNLGLGTTSPTDKLHINSTAGQDALRVQVNGASKLRVHQNGNVSVGSATQGPDNGLYVLGNLHIGTVAGATGYKAAINGKLICEEIRVQDSGAWPDYVFGNDYKLKSINDVEEFIAKNKHLPDVPPASLIEKEGYELARMDANLLRKIEELTLYLIDITKQNSDLQNRLTILENIKK